ncbi:MAG: PorT family protein [Rikenellaceae bacterium]|nr:PorT family protein [Rikenellaceae bacterium]
MILKKTITAAAVCLAAIALRGSAQTLGRGHDLSFVAGFNIGATTPVPIPSGLKITGYNPRFNPKVGANFGYFFNDHWGMGTGFLLSWKRMKVNTKVTEVHLTVDVPDIGELTGYVTGKNTTKVSTLYLDKPIYGIYRINPKWQVKAGVYLASVLSRNFKGTVHDITIVVESPVEQERGYDYATFDYSKSARKLDIGLFTGAEFRMNQRIGFFAEFTWGLRPYFHSKVPIEFVMRNIYFSTGMTFRL